MNASNSPKNISELPTVAVLNKLPKNPYFTLPVVVLYGFKCRNIGVLLVTDLTSHEESRFAGRDSPQFLKSHFTIGNRRLAQKEIIVIAVNLEKMAWVNAELEKVWSGHDPQSIANGIFFDVSQNCIVALLTFEWRNFNNQVEGYLSHLQVGDYTGIVSLINQKMLGIDSFHELINRIWLGMTDSLYSEIRRYEPPSDSFARNFTTPTNTRLNYHPMAEQVSVKQEE